MGGDSSYASPSFAKLMAMQRSHRRKIRQDLRSLLVGLLFISPWLVGFFLFLVYPVVANFYLGMTQYSGFGPPQWIGFQNYAGACSGPTLLEIAL